MRPTMSSRYRARLNKLDAYVSEKFTSVEELQYEIDLTLLTDAELDLLAEAWRINNKGEQMGDAMRLAIDDIKMRTARLARG